MQAVEPRRDGSSRRVVLGLFAASLLLYAPTLGFPLFWDDTLLITGSAMVRAAPLSELLLAPFWQVEPGRPPLDRALYWRPVVSLSFRLDGKLRERVPIAFHLTNVLVNALVVAAAALLLRRLLPAPWWGLAALLFAAHPAHVECVAFVSGRTDLFAALFVLLALLAVDRDPPGPGWTALGALCTLLAALSKETAFALPALWLAWRLARDGGGARAALRRAPREIGPSLIVLAALLAFRLARFGGLVGGQRPPFDLGQAAGHVLDSIGGYAELIALPWRHSAWHLPPPAGGRLVGLLIALALAAAALLSRQAVVRAGALWTAAALVPALNLLPVRGAYVAERNLYIASFGIAWALAALGAALPRPGARLRHAALLALALLGALDAARRSRVWRSPELFFAQLTRDEPRAPAGWAGLANAKRMAGKTAEAIEISRRATQVSPQTAEGWINLGIALFESGQSFEAARVLHRATVLGADEASIWSLLGAARIRAGDLAGARSALDRALALDPELPDVWGHLAQWLAATGDHLGAAEASRRAAGLAPGDANAQHHLGAALLHLERWAEAAAAFRRALEIQEGHLPALLGLATCERSLGRRDSAVALIEQWLLRHPEARGSPQLLEWRQAVQEEDARR